MAVKFLSINKILLKEILRFKSTIVLVFKAFVGDLNFESGCAVILKKE